MRIRKLTATLVAAALLVGAAGSAFASTHTVPGNVYGIPQSGTLPQTVVAQKLQQSGVRDVQPDHWAAGSVTVLLEAGLVRPDAGGNLRPEGPVNAAQGVAIFAKVLGIASKTDDDTTAAQKMQQAGLVSNVSATAPMTRVEVAKLIGTALGIEPVGLVTRQNFPFNDYDSFSAEERGLLVALHRAGIFKGFPDGTFRPGETLTVAQIAMLIDRLLGSQ